VSCGSRLVHTPNALNILAGTIILASFHPRYSLNFDASNATTLGLDTSPTLLVLADEVIE
jgi:hypothetical protein